MILLNDFKVMIIILLNDLKCHSKPYRINIKKYETRTLCPIHLSNP